MALGSPDAWLRIGGVMHVLVRGRWFGIGSAQKRLERATTSLKDFCKAIGRQVSLSRLTQDNLTLKKDKFPDPWLLTGFVHLPAQELRAKGYDSFLILKWLADLLKQNVPAEFSEVAALVWCADTFVSMLCEGAMFLSEQTAVQVQYCGEAFMKLYLQQVDKQPRVWKLRPKWHMCFHLAVEANSRPSRRNPGADSTWMDEDWIKRVSRIIRKCSKNSAPRNTCHRWLLMFQQTLKRAKKAA